MKKSKVSLGLVNLNPSEKVEFARAVILSMTGNISFANAAVLIAALIVASDDLETATMKALDKSTLNITTRNQMEKVLDDVFTQLADHVDSVAKGDPVIILSAGMPLKSSNTSPAPLGKVIGVNVSPRTNEGEIVLYWSALKNCRAYVIEQSSETEDVPEDTKVMQPAKGIWKVAGVVIKRKFKVSGLVGSNKYAFRIYGVGPLGYGIPSETIIAKAF